MMMNEQSKQKMRLVVNGAVSIYEEEGLEIPDILKAHERTDLCEAYDAIGTALYWIKEELEK